eukprot:CAMPEP_0181255458 /NCGR_PEP_ID=MMETSP1096-20121128/49159_1 /TAXON_ID=156174 ORGANISM="Chrysochromulina ericina, Strain CCMP281" /NCGR_SAMPLE_ID=MMETSP1096 /ASSEMBLY_ACC=CAM_ASM_000453 /LENGTH=64 /DNA_ID=CAMNT_0023353585 /DNA_START=474 /DNA_END=664 /DNA_ORIENTATION=-
MTIRRTAATGSVLKSSRRIAPMNALGSQISNLPRGGERNGVAGRLVAGSQEGPLPQLVLVGRFG